MATAPARTELSDAYPNPSNATMRTGMGKLWDWATGLLGTDGTAATAQAALGIGNVLLHSSINSNVATIDLTTIFTSTYDLYEIHLYDVIARTAGSTLNMRMSTDNGATFITTAGAYAFSRSGAIGSANFSVNGTGAEASMAVGINSSFGAKFDCCLNRGGGAAGIRASMEYHGGYYSSPGTERVALTGSVQVGQDSINALRFFMSAGNIDAKLLVYGLRKA